MKSLRLFIATAAILCLNLSESFSQEGTIDTLDYLSGDDNYQPEEDIPKNVTPRRTNGDNFTIDELIGGPRLSQDPTVQKAEAAAALRESQNTITSTSITRPTFQFIDEAPDDHKNDNLVNLIITITIAVVLLILIKIFHKPRRKLL